MKVLLFTDEHDIDGMGSVIICKRAFEQFDYITCKRFEVEDKFKQAMQQDLFKGYDLIMMADICLREPLLGIVNADSELKDKLMILDHHKTELAANQYSFCKVEVENEQGLASGTSLCFEYLVNNGYLKPTATLTELVELTRQYDTWEWKTKYHNPKPRMLHILFEQLGYERYLTLLQELTANHQGLLLRDSEMALIKSFEDNLESTIKAMLPDIKVKPLNVDEQTYNIGLIEIPYAYRNDLPDYLREHQHLDIDILAMLIADGDTVSYRGISDVDVSKVALYFGGKGHQSAGGSPKDNPLLVSFIQDTALIRKKA